MERMLYIDSGAKVGLALAGVRFSLEKLEGGLHYRTRYDILERGHSNSVRFLYVILASTHPAEKLHL